MKDKTIKRLPDAELEVMQAVWACEIPASRADIEQILYPEYPMAVTTLLTLLTRLGEKGFLKIEKEGRKCHYIPCVSKEDYLAEQSKTFFQKLCGGNLSVFANALYSGGLSKEDIEQLRELLDKGEL